MMNYFQNILFNVVVILSIILWIKWLWKRRNLYKISFQYPCLWGWPLIGASLKMINFDNIIPTFGEMFEKTKSHTLVAWLGPEANIISDDPDFIEKILTSSEMYNRGKAVNKPGMDAVGSGLLTETAEQWKPLRKKLNPCFRTKILASWMPVFNKSAKYAIEDVKPMVGQGPQELYHLLKKINLETSIEIFMGIDRSSGKTEEKEKYNKCLDCIFDSMGSGFVLVHLNLLWIRKFQKSFQNAKKFLKDFVGEFLIEIYNKRAQSRKEMEILSGPGAENDDDDMYFGKKKPKVFIDLMLNLYEQKQLDWLDITTNSNNMIVAALETSSKSIYSTLILLAMHPEVQEKLYQCIANETPGDDFEVDFDMLDRIPYLEMVINETLRLIPPIPVINRQADKDTTLGDGLFLPKDMQVVISFYHLHRREDIWGPDANSFNPDHFLPENINKRHSSSFVPFSKGSRNCIGWRYAILTLKVFLVRFLLSYRVETDFQYKDLKFSIDCSIRYMEYPKLKINSRK